MATHTPQQITELEKEASKPEAIPALMAYIEEFNKGGPRVELIRNLEGAIKGMDCAMEITRGVALGVLAGIHATAAPGRPLEVEVARQQVQRQVEANKAVIEQQVLTSLLYAYRTLTDGELTQYIEFAETPSARQYHQATSAALSAVMLSACEAIGVEVGKSLAVSPK